MHHPPQSVTVISSEGIPRQAFDDLINGAKLYKVWSFFAFNDIKQRFRRSVIGPVWITLSMGVMIGAMGLVFSQLFHQDMSQTLPYIAVGIIVWGLLTACISDGTTIFVSAEATIRNVPLPVSFHFYRMMTRNLIIMGFNSVIYFLILIFFDVKVTASVVLFFPGFLLYVINISWMSFAAGIISTRYRDVPPLINNVIQVIFFVTPVFWSPATMASRPAFVTLNPAYHLLEIVRAPLLGEPFPALSWFVSLALAMFGIAFVMWLYRRAYARISYWV